VVRYVLEGKKKEFVLEDALFLFYIVGISFFVSVFMIMSISMSVYEHICNLFNFMRRGEKQQND